MSSLACNLSIAAVVTLGLTACDGSRAQIAQTEDGNTIIVESRLFQASRVSIVSDGVLWRVPNPQQLQSKLIGCEETIDAMRSKISVTAVWVANSLHARAVLLPHVPTGKKSVSDEEWRSYIESNMGGYRPASFNVDLLGLSDVGISRFTFDASERTKATNMAAFTLVHTSPIDPRVFIAATSECNVSWHGWEDYPEEISPEEVNDGLKQEAQT